MKRQAYTIRLPVHGPDWTLTLFVANGHAGKDRAFVASVVFFNAAGAALDGPYEGFGHSEKVGAYFYVAGGRPEAPVVTSRNIIVPARATEFEVTIQPWIFKGQPIALAAPPHWGPSVPRIPPEILVHDEEGGPSHVVRRLNLKQLATFRALLGYGTATGAAPRVAGILPDDLREDIAREPLSLTAIDTDNMAVLSKEQYEMLLIVPDGHLYASGWKSELLVAGRHIRSAVSTAKARGIPVVLWFVARSPDEACFEWLTAEADLVCTRASDRPAGSAESTERELSAPGDGRTGPVLALPVAFQPRMYNPFTRVEDHPIHDSMRDGIVLDGWWTSVNDAQDSEELARIRSRLSIVESAWAYDRFREKDNAQFWANSLGCIDTADRAMVAKFWGNELFIDDRLQIAGSAQKRAIEAIGANCRPIMVSSELHESTLGDLIPERTLAEVVADHETGETDATHATQLREMMALHVARRRLLATATYRRALDLIRDRLSIPQQAPEPPLVSVILVSKRPWLIEDCLRKVADQSYPRIEFIYVLHGSHPNAGATLERAREAGAIALSFDDTFSLSACLNVAIKHCSGDYVAKFDDDDSYGANFVSDLISYRQMVDYDVVGRPIGFVFDAARERLMYDPSSVRREWKVSDPSEELVLPAGAALLGKRDVFERIGYPEERRGGADSEFLRRCQRAGIAVYSADIFNFVVYRDADRGFHTWIRPDRAFRAMIDVSAHFELADLMI